MAFRSTARSLTSIFLMASLSAPMAIAPREARADASSAVAARRLYDQGKELQSAGKYAEACPKLEESQRLDPAPETLLQLAECYDKTGRSASAWSKLVEAEQLAHAAGQHQLARTARERATRLAPRLSNVVIEVAAGDSTPGLEVRRDNAIVSPSHWGVPIPADPGPHDVTATAPGRHRWDIHLRLPANGTTTTVRVPALAPETGPGAPMVMIAPVPWPGRAPAGAPPPVAPAGAAPMPSSQGMPSWAPPPSVPQSPAPMARPAPQRPAPIARMAPAGPAPLDAPMPSRPAEPPRPAAALTRAPKPASARADTPIAPEKPAPPAPPPPPKTETASASISSLGAMPIASDADTGTQSHGLGAQRAIALVAVGAGIAGVAVGTVFGLKSKSQHDAALADGHCDATYCYDDEGFANRSNAQKSGNVSTVAFIAGGVGLAAGAVLWLTGKPHGAHSTAELRIGPGTIGLGGTW